MTVLARTGFAQVGPAGVEGAEARSAAATPEPGAPGAVVAGDAGGAEAEASPASPIEISGYGELLFRYHDYGPNQAQPGGAPAESRLVFDTTRFVLALEGELGAGVEWEAEIELEHGGTGSAFELEYDEFGEFESEVEKGGEVLLEELYLERDFGDHLEVKAGRFYVALGLLSYLYRPTDYLGAARPESEEIVVPGQWDEQGVSAKVELGPAEITAQIVSGLDSTGFSSDRWIGGGHQGRFELTRATGLAAVLRADLTPTPGVLVGASGYVTDAADNRPKPDMEGTTATLVIADAHAVVDLAPFRARAVAIWGRLANADVISEKNSRLPNSLRVPLAPVAEQALATWAELGVDVAPWLALATAHRLEPFVRFEHYDTMLVAGDHTFDNQRFKRSVFQGGVAYTLVDRFVATADVSHRRLGDSDLRAETSVELSLGFVY